MKKSRVTNEQVTYSHTGRGCLPAFQRSELLRLEEVPQETAPAPAAQTGSEALLKDRAPVNCRAIRVIGTSAVR